MSSPETVEITGTEHFDAVLKSNRIVVADFYADWCGPCKQIAPIFQNVAQQHSKAGVSAFVKVNVDNQKPIASRYSVTALPTFIIFRDGEKQETVKGADVQKLTTVTNKLLRDIENTTAGGSGSSSGGGVWRGAAIVKGQSDISDVVDVKNLELLNIDNDSSVRTLFEKEKPSALDKGKSADGSSRDWVESESDDQMLLYIPFNSSVTLHSLQLTSLPPKDEDDEAPVRPGTIRLFINKQSNLSFSDAEEIEATEEIKISESDWNAEGTADIALKLRRFSRIYSLVVFVTGSSNGASDSDSDSDSDDDETRTRLDRIRIIGVAGEKREMGQLQKHGDEQGE